MPKIDLVSDLHLECQGLTLPGGDILILAGDAMQINNYMAAFHSTRLPGPPRDRYLSFFETECAKYQLVLYIPGNHEYYDSVYDDSLASLKRAMPSNVKILHRDVYDAGDILFVGATLWTDCNRLDWHTMYHLKKCMSDFQTIRKPTGERFLPEDSVIEHERDLDYIKLITTQNAQRDIFVVTHHTPSWQSCHARYVNDKLLNGAFHTELSGFIMAQENIKFWAHGHTHYTFDYNIAQCRVICNPRGYWPYEQSKDYSPKYITG